MVTLHEVITCLVSMQISISSLQTHNVNRCGRSRHLARKLSIRRKRSSPNVFEMAATETITSSILIMFFNDTATTEIYTLSLHDALPISTYSSWPLSGLTQTTAYAWRASRAISRPTSTLRSEEHTSELQSLAYIGCRLLVDKKKTTETITSIILTHLITVIFGTASHPHSF